MSPFSSQVVPNPDSPASKERQVREMFSRIAPTYDLLNRVLSMGIDQRWRDYAAKHLTIPSPARILDLCGGTGDVAMKVLERRPGDTVTVADFAQPMLAKASARLASAGPRHAALCGDALQLPFPGDCFDGSVCAFGVRNWVDLEAGLAEVMRILRPGGEFAILDFLQAGHGVSDALGRLYIHHVLPAVGSLVSGDRRAYRYLAESMEGFCSDTEFRATVQACGFEIVQERRFFLGLCWFFLLRKPLPLDNPTK
jgi:demethylmenaquinone methyltransferase/2-methoxy-6-polyprenyl-1,4-benzoquinol methylase